MKEIALLASLLAALVLFAEAARGGETPARRLEEQVRRQGDQIRKLTAEIERLKMRPDRDRGALEQEVERYLAGGEDLGPGVPASRRSGLAGGRVHLGGYFSLEYREDGERSRNEFDFHRLVLKVQSEVGKGIRFETEIEFEGGGAGPEFLQDNEILVEYAELSFELIEDKLAFKVGALLVPWGRFNQLHDDPINELTDRPLVARRIAAAAFDQPGIGIEGTLEPAGGWFLDYDLALVQGFGEGFTTSGGVRGARQSFRSDNNENKQVFGRFVVSPPLQAVDVFELGTSFTYGKYDAAGKLSDYGFAFDLFVKRGPIQLTAEYMNLRIEQPAGAPDTKPRRMDGWYVELSYHFFPAPWRGRHRLFGEESTFALIVRVEGLDLNDRTRGTTFRDGLDQITFGFDFRPVQRTVFKISYTFVDSDAAGFGGGAADRFLMSWASYF